MSSLSGNSFPESLDSTYLRPRFRADRVIALFFVMVVLASLFLPEKQAPDSFGFVSFQAFMVSIVPSIAHISELTHEPAHAKFFLSIIWASLPIQIVILLYTKGVFIFEKAYEKRALLPFFLFAMVPFLYLFFMYIWGSDPGGPLGRKTLSAATGSRIGLALVTEAMLLSVAIFTAIMLQWFIHIPKLYFNKHEKM